MKSDDAIRIKVKLMQYGEITEKRECDWLNNNNNNNNNVFHAKKAAACSSGLFNILSILQTTCTSSLAMIRRFCS